MAAEHQLLSQILRALADALDRRDRKLVQRIFEAAVGNQESLALRPSKGSRRKATRVREPINSDELRREIAQFASREALEDYLLDRFTRKDELLAAAKALKVSISKSDTYDALIDKIIDATLGYVMRSRAIRGHAAEG